jgi:prepilin-type processing-associated H-X9-DG protein
MPQINCPHCGHAFSQPAETAAQYAGRLVRCDGCQQLFVVPGAPIRAPAQIAYATPYRVRLQPNDQAVASLRYALLGIVVPVIPGVAAIVLGIKGMRNARNREVGGIGSAVAGITIGAITVLIGSILILAVSEAIIYERETANRVKCASNMRDIGQALYQYANNNSGQFPARLEDLVLAQRLDTRMFVCPGSSDTPADGATAQARAAALASGGHNSYVYVPNLSTSATADTVVLYERAADHSGGSEFLFADGHVESIYKTYAGGMIAEIKSGHNPPRPGHY